MDGGQPYYRQRDTEGNKDTFLYSEGGQWLVSYTLGKSVGELTNYRDSVQPPVEQWLYWDGDGKKQRDDDTSLSLEFTTLSPCKLVRVAGEGEVVEKRGSSLGDYRSEYISLLNIIQSVNYHHPKIFK